MMNKIKSYASKHMVLWVVIIFIIGLYLGVFVQPFVNDLIMQIITPWIPQTALEEVMIGPFRVGHFLGTTISLLIAALTILVLTLLMAALTLLMLVKQAKKMRMEQPQNESNCFEIVTYITSYWTLQVRKD
jgi:large-conductance mechanosensitive channel